MVPMDVACCVYQPNSLHGCEGTSHRVLSRLHSRLAYRSLKQESIDWKGRSSRRIKKAVVCSSRLNSSSISIRGLHSHWWSGYPNNSIFSGSCDIVTAPSRLKRYCQGKDSLAYIDENGRNVELEKDSSEGSRMDSSDSVKEVGEQTEADILSLDELRELLQKAVKELEVARLNSAMFEEKAQQISEAAIALKDDAATAWNDVDSALDVMQQIVNEESVAKEAAQKATMSLSLAEARLMVAIDSSETLPGETVSPEESTKTNIECKDNGKDQPILAAREDIKICHETSLKCEAELKQLQNKKEEMQQELDRLKGVADKAQEDALKVDEEVGNVMLMAEQAVAVELEAAQRVSFAEIALRRAEKFLSGSNVDTSETAHGYFSGDEAVLEGEKVDNELNVDIGKEIDLLTYGDVLVGEPVQERLSAEDLAQIDNTSNQEKNAQVRIDRPQARKQEMQKDAMKESSPPPQKASLKKSSRFFSASFFSFAVDGAEFTPASVFQSLMQSAKNQLPKLVVGLLLVGGGVALYGNRVDRRSQLLQQSEIVTSSIEEVFSSAKPLIVHMKKLPKKVKQLLAKLPHQEAYCSAPLPLL